MKCTWGAEDIKVGRRYSKPGIKEKWIIGYMANIDEPERYVSISCSDGMVTEPITKERLAWDLTEQGYLPIELI